MNIKKLLALLLVAAMCLTLLAACSSNEPAGSDDKNNVENGDANTPANGDEDDEDEEMAEITMCYFDVNSNGDKANHVLEAINEITEEKYNVHVDITWWSIADYSTQLSLAASSGDLPDVIGGFPMVNITSMQTNGYLSDLTPYLETEDAAGFMSVVGQYMDGFKFAGGVWGIPTHRIYVTSKYIIMRKDILDSIGMVEQAQNLETWAQYEEILAAVADAYQGETLYPVGKGSGRECFANVDVQWTSIDEGGAFSDHILTDKLGDTLHWFCADNDGNVIALYENEYYIDACEKAKEWYDKGWLYPDGAYSDDHGDTVMKQGIIFSDFQSSEVGIESAKQTATGYEVVCAPVSGAMIKTSDLTTWGIGLSNSCSDPEAALRFISALYTDADLNNLITWGVEGVDYTVTDGEATSIEGGYFSGDWIHGNQFLKLPAAGQGADFRDVSLAANQAAVNSPYLGFAVDLTEMSNQIAAITGVDNEYYGTITGGYYTESLLKEMTDKMEAAGAKEYIATYQEQLTEWMNNK